MAPSSLITHPHPLGSRFNDRCRKHALFAIRNA